MFSPCLRQTNNSFALKKKTWNEPGILQMFQLAFLPLVSFLTILFQFADFTTHYKLAKEWKVLYRSRLDYLWY